MPPNKKRFLLVVEFLHRNPWLNWVNSKYLTFVCEIFWIPFWSVINIPIRDHEESSSVCSLCACWWPLDHWTDQPWFTRFKYYGKSQKELGRQILNLCTFLTIFQGRKQNKFSYSDVIWNMEPTLLKRKLWKWCLHSTTKLYLQDCFNLYFRFLGTRINSIPNVISKKNVKYCPFYC